MSIKVLHVLDHSLPVQSGYSFRSAAILREQRAMGFRTLQVTGPKQGAVDAASQEIDGLSYERTTGAATPIAGLPGGEPLDVIVRLRRRLREVVARERPDLVHAHSPCLNALAALGLGPPLVYEMRSSWEDAAVSTGTTAEGSMRYRLSRALETFVLRRASAVTTICEGLRREIEARGVPSARITVVPNAVDADALAAATPGGGRARRERGLEGAFVIGFLGSFFAWEGLDLLIEAMPQVLGRRPEARLLLVGAGVAEPALRSAIDRLGLAREVVFAGPVAHGEVAALYDAVDLLAYPRLPMRLTEMVTPLKPLEAMALGKAMVASDVGGHRELIADGETGLLFRAGDREALAAAILRVIDDPSLAARLRATGPAHVRRHRNWRQSVANYAPVYAALAGSAR
jgi:PEP-CTERM/exosortase A-associated glycosyltransferase